MSEPYIKQAFMDTYEECADDIFLSCYQATNHHHKALALTKSIFYKAWDTINEVGYVSVSVIKNIIRQIAQETLATLHHKAYSKRDNLWNLTLAQPH